MGASPMSAREELLQRADLISLHLPLIMGDNGTYHIINDDTIAMMRRDNVMLVNTPAADW